MAPKSANTAGHASQVSRWDISSSAAHPVSPMADIARPSAIVAQNSHWQPRHVCRRRTMTLAAVSGGTSRATARKRLRVVGWSRSSQPVNA